MSDDMPLCLTAALSLDHAGLCVVPARADGSKAPEGFWKAYQAQRPSARQLHMWFAQSGEYDGLGVICGAVSGQLEMLEFEGRAMAEGVYDAWRGALADHGLTQLWKRITDGYTETSPSGGFHVLFRTDGRALGNTKLARRPATAAELTVSPEKTKPLIETRGEGGFVVTAPSGGRTHPTGKPWKLLSGSPASIVTISESERDALYRVARLLDQMPAPATRPALPQSPANEELRPGDDFAARTSWAEILQPHGWQLLTSNPAYQGWQRPGKTGPGLSATTREDGGLFVFSTSTEFEPEVPYTKFGAYAVLNHGGDHSAAARRLAGDGYGAQARSTPNSQVSTNGRVSPPPAPADPLPAIPRFPVHLLTGPLASFADWCIRDGLHPEGAVGAGLAALTALTGPASLRIGAKNIRAILWIVLVGAASSGKSPVFEHALALITRDFESRYDQYTVELAEWQDKHHAGGAAAAGAKPAEPEPVVWDDPTIQSVARWLNSRARTPGGDSSGAVIDDELVSILAALDPERGGSAADRGKWLKLWTGVPLILKRVGSGGEANQVSIVTPKPVCSLAGNLVPGDLPLLGKQGSGFRPRWLPFYLPARKPQWLHAGAYPDDWEKCIAALLSYRQPRDWYLKNAARDMWDDARSRWNRQQDNAEPDDVIEALRKADMQCLRIALVIAESLSPAAGGDIPEKAMQCAVAIVDYTIAAWRALPGSSVMIMSRAEDVMDTVYHRMLTWLESRPKGNEGLPPGSAPRPRATRSELQRWIHEKPEKINALIMEHEARFPGCKIIMEQPGGHGLPTVYLYFPERAPGEVLPQHLPPEALKGSVGDESAGHAAESSAGGGIARGVAMPFATPHRNTSSARGPAPGETARTGPCRRCGQPCHRHEDGGDPLCTRCQTIVLRENAQRQRHLNNAKKGKK